MPMTIPQYARDRHVSDKGVYKAIERHPEIKALIYKGRPNGKEVKMLSDDAIGMLDQVMRHPYQGLEDIQKDLQIFHADELSRKDSEIAALREQISEQKDLRIAEIEKTRETMVSEVRTAVSEAVAIDYDKINDSINELKAGLLTVEQSALITKENKELKARNTRLQKQIDEIEKECRELSRDYKALQQKLKIANELLEEAQNHPIINWIEFKKRKRKNKKGQQNA